MPRAISVMRKYFEALSRAFSAPGESYRVGLAMRYPAGGGPDGSAARRALVEKVAARGAVRDVGSVRKRGPEVRASAVIDLVEAMAL
jgi:hypothetical protein